MIEYRLLSYRDKQGAPQAGVLFNGRVLPVSSLLAEVSNIDRHSVLGLLQTWERAHAAIMAALRNVKATDGLPIGQVSLLAPVLYPGAVFCTGANYWDHLDEMMARIARMQGKPAPTRPARAQDPWFFLKTPRQCVVGTDTDVRMPARSKKLDYEAEIAVIIGKPARQVSVETAMDYVAGYTCVNDLSARDLSTHEDRQGTRMHVDWISHKCFDDGLPMGPWITPAPFVPDPYDMDVKLWINGELKQDSNSRHMIHNISEQIATLSRQITLMPGDVIATGTPAGVGAGRGKDGEFLHQGDVVEIEVEHVGRLINRMVADR